VQQDSRVTDILAAVRPLAPFVFDDQMIVAVLLVRGDVAVPLARQTDLPIRDLEYLPWIFALRVFEPGRQAGQIPAVEKLNGLARRGRLVRALFGGDFARQAAQRQR
jgi:hypothetical protein